MMENISRRKNNLLISFIEAIKEAAVDCELFKAHNMMGSKYSCFKFNEESLFDRNIGPAYNKDIEIDGMMDNGSNAIDSINTEITNTTDSEFYQLINVSQQDIDLREDLIVQLQQDQRSLLDLLEAPSNVIVGIGNQQPAADQGKQGDYFINQNTRTIYGPKISDTEWPQGINY